MFILVAIVVAVLFFLGKDIVTFNGCVGCVAWLIIIFVVISIIGIIFSNMPQ